MKFFFILIRELWLRNRKLIDENSRLREENERMKNRLLKAYQATADMQAIINWNLER